MQIKSIRKEKRFVPEFNGNKNLPEAEQIVVHLKGFPSVLEAKKYKSYRFNDSGGIEITYPNDEILFTRHVGTITNIILDAEYPPITNGVGLSKSKCLELDPIVTEIREYLLQASEPVSDEES